MNKQYRLEILRSALDARIKEVTEYQVNIDNFRLAIERVGDDPGLSEFRTQLEQLLQSSLLEQRKAQIMLDVIRQQLE
jgi:muramoyltetrapeptide carboxypeptidase LdcA involved in peptidoglycan recycling